VRLFIAINLPPEQRRAIYAAAAPLRAASGDVAWVNEDRLHFTLKFLGEQPSDAADALGSALRPVAARYRPITLQLGGVGAFPSLRAPRVVWLGIAHDAKLELLHHDVESACAALGYEIDGRAFRPHLTLGRIRRELDRAGVRTLADAAEAVEYGDEVEVHSVELMSSTLGRSGSRYAVLETLPLRAA
jgi:2'-5' RNA ligase